MSFLFVVIGLVVIWGNIHYLLPMALNPVDTMREDWSRSTREVLGVVALVITSGLFSVGYTVALYPWEHGEHYWSPAVAAFAIIGGARLEVAIKRPKAKIPEESEEE